MRVEDVESRSANHHTHLQFTPCCIAFSRNLCEHILSLSRNCFSEHVGIITSKPAAGVGKSAKRKNEINEKELQRMWINPFYDWALVCCFCFLCVRNQLPVRHNESCVCRRLLLPVDRNTLLKVVSTPCCMLFKK